MLRSLLSHFDQRIGQVPYLPVKNPRALFFVCFHYHRESQLSHGEMGWSHSRKITIIEMKDANY